MTDQQSVNKNETVRQGGGVDYVPPDLALVGNAVDIVLGPPGGGADGPFGMTEPDFEFQEDGRA